MKKVLNKYVLSARRYKINKGYLSDLSTCINEGMNKYTSIYHEMAIFTCPTDIGHSGGRDLHLSTSVPLNHLSSIYLVSLKVYTLYACNNFFKMCHSLNSSMEIFMKRHHALKSEVAKMLLL